MWGGLAGARTGALFGLALRAEEGGSIDFGPEAIPIGMLGGGVLGGAVGGIIGGLTTSDRWRPGADAIAVTAGGDRVGLSARLTF